MRGKPLKYLMVFKRERITPADAGKTIILLVYCELYKDHPRGCGENQFLIRILTILIGSPPRMRGKRQHFLQLQRGQRITPADAGKTF